MKTPPPDYEVVPQWRVACDGSGGALGHPRVFLSIDRDSGYAICGYCGKLWVNESRESEVLKEFSITEDAG
ncbi:MAG: zinc-finger domain-containing protein [Pseudomonadota bacterium]